MTDHRTLIGQDNKSEILNWFISQGKPMTLTECVDALDNFAYSTVHRHIQALIDEGMLKVAPLEKSRRNTRVAFVAVTTDKLSLPLRGKLTKVSSVTSEKWITGNFNATVALSAAKQLGDDNIQKTAIIRGIKAHPDTLVAQAMVTMYNIAGELPDSNYPRITRQLIEDAIDSHQAEIVTLRAMLNCGPLWDRRALPDLLNKVKQETRNTMREFMALTVPD